MEKEFEALRESNREEVKQLKARFARKNKHLAEAPLRQGLLIEYVRDYDHLYATFGEPREGMALFTEHTVVMADPETLELVAFEIPDFMKQLAAGKLPAFVVLARMLENHPVIYIPPAEQTEPAVEEIARELAAV